MLILLMDGAWAESGRILDWITIKRNDINLLEEDKYGHYWIEILDGPNGKPVESYGWWPKDSVDPVETLVGVPGELNGQTHHGGTPTTDPDHDKPADTEFHPRLMNTLTDQQVLDKIHEFVRSYKGEWRWTLGWGQNCRTFQTALMNYVGIAEPNTDAISGTDSTPPTVQAFDVSPSPPILNLGESFTIDYTVSDTGGPGLNRVELWRKDEQSDWQEIKRDALSGDGPTSDSFSDAPSNSGKYWYGIHVVDNAGNWNDEKNSNSNDQPGGFSPVEVEVRSTQTAETPENSDAIALNDNGVALYNQGKYEEALECFNEATRIDPKYAKAWDNKATVLLALDRCDEFKAADEMAGSLGLINFRNPLTYIKCG
jgi:hypothetical protein